MRVVIVEDQGFYLDLLTDGLRGRGIDVVVRAGNPTEALHVINITAPDLGVLDISLSSARVHDTEGLRVAELVRAHYPDVGLLMLSAHMEPAYARRLLAMEDNPCAVGYLGKEHLGNLNELIDAFHRIVRDGTVIDSEIISQLMSRRRVTNPLERLTPSKTHSGPGRRRSLQPQYHPTPRLQDQQCGTAPVHDLRQTQLGTGNQPRSPSYEPPGTGHAGLSAQHGQTQQLATRSAESLARAPRTR